MPKARGACNRGCMVGYTFSETALVGRSVPDLPLPNLLQACRIPHFTHTFWAFCRPAGAPPDFPASRFISSRENP